MTTKNAHDLILRVAQAFVAKPEALTLQFQEGEDGAIYWILQGHEDDEGKLVGNGGAHVDALRFIVTEFGRASQRAYTFRLVTNRPPGERVEQPRVNVAEYDPSEIANLLTEMLCQFDIGEFLVETTNGDGRRTTLAFAFVIKLANPTDYSAMIAQRKFKHREGETMSLIGALGTLFRAMAKIAGVEFKIVVEEPKLVS